jgi:hypothetical protein
MQTKLGSLLETIANTVVGVIVSIAIGHFLYPMFGAQVSLADNLWLTLIFTATGMARSYVLRRYFNRHHIEV